MLAELEKQRSAILSLLQRGKDLSRELNAPEFLKEDVRNLEKKWNTSYGSAMDRRGLSVVVSPRAVSAIEVQHSE